ncbi:hypothetical protein PVAND_005026 [Polypedilum vanderplanki]|uniref:Uncharacterized protein n=1 Tax=Polypedilum vanderplanki TaxID=319348 RepID=A0A9J6C0T0_POLVA|nr:hypothetical protein PVAND_005026 [Polypedilum vanderplanki]
MKIISLLIFTILFVKSHQKIREIYYYNLSLIANEKFINESKLSIQCEINIRKNPCIYAPTIMVVLKQDINRVYAQIKAKDVNSNKIILDQLLNICMFESQTLDLLIKVVLDLLKNHLSFPIKCPFKKGKYETYAFKQDYGVFVNLFPINQPQRYTALIKAKIGKKLEAIVNLSLDFEIVENE